MTVYLFPPALHVDADNLPGQTFEWTQIFSTFDLTGYTATMTIDGIAVNLPCAVAVLQIGANVASTITLTSQLGATTSTWLPGVYAYRVTLTAPDATTSIAAYGSLLELSPRAGTVYGTVGPQGPQGVQGPPGASGSGITFQTSPVGPVSIGQMLSPYGVSPTVKTLQVATPAILAAGGAAIFMATANALASASVTAAQTGDKVDHTVTGLGAGVACPVAIDPVTFKAVRLPVADGRPIVGVTDTSGNVTLTGFVFSQGPKLVFNPASPKYGAVYGVTTDPVVLKANLVAWNRMMADIRANTPVGSHVIHVPGVLALYDTAFVKSASIIEGLGGSNQNGPSIIYGNGVDEVLNLCPAAEGVKLTHIAVNGKLTTSPSLLPSTATAVAAGITRRAPRNNRVQFRCIVAGTTASALPSTFLKPNCTTPDRFSFGAQYAVGDTIYPSRRSSRYGFYAYTVTASGGITTAGTLGFVDNTTEPVWPVSISVLATSSGAGSVYVLQFPAAHGLLTGDVMTVAGVGAGADGSRTVTFVDATHVSLNGTAYAAGYTTGGTVSTAGGTVVSGDLTFAAHALSDFLDSNTPGNNLAVQTQLFHGTSVWYPEAIDAVTSHCKTTAESCSFNNVLCSGWNLYSALDGADIARCTVIGSSGNDVRYAGVGAALRVHGFLSAATSFSNMFCFSAGLDPNTGQDMPGQGGDGYEDDSLLGAVFTNCSGETFSGHSFISTLVGSSTWLNCYSDGDHLGAIYRNHATVLNGQESGFSDDGTTCFLGSRNNGVLTQNSPNDNQGPFQLHAAPIRNGGTGVYAWGSSHERGGLSFFEKRHDNFFYGWSFESYCAGGSTLRQIEGWSGARAAEGLGNKWAFYGCFLGENPTQIYDGYGPHTATDTNVRFGKRNVGDRYRSNTAPGLGDFTHKIIVTAGSIGNLSAWVASTAYTLQNYSDGTPPTCYSPGDGYTYMWCGAPGGITSSGSAPTWGASTVTGPRARLWATGIVTFPGDKWHDGAGHLFEVANPTAWTTNLPIKPNDVTGVLAANGRVYDAFQAQIPVYGGSSGFRVGSIVQPTAKNHPFAWQVSSVVYRGIASSDPGAIGLAGAEPTWPAALTVTGTASGAGSVYVLAYGSAHGATTGDVLLVHGVGTGADGYRTITVVDSTHLSLNGTTYAAGYTSGGYTAESTTTVVYFGDTNYQITWTAIQLVTGAAAPKWSQTHQPYEVEPLTFGIVDNNIVWQPVSLTTGPTTPSWVTTTPSVSLTADTSTSVPFNYLYDGTFSMSALLPDGTGMWMRIDPVPVEANTGGKILTAGMLTLSANGTAILTRPQGFAEMISTTQSLDFGVGGSGGAHQAASQHRVLNTSASDIAVAPAPTGVPFPIIPANTLYTFSSNGTALYQENPSQSPIYRPTSKAGLQFWARADLLSVLNGTTVSKATDATNQGRNLTQGTTAKQPTYHVGGIGSKNTFTFSSASSTFLFGPATDLVTTALTAFCVVKCTSLGLQEQPFGKAYSATEWCFQGVGSGTGKIQFAINGANVAVSNAAINDGNPHVLIATWDKTVSGGLITLYVDGVAQTTTGTTIATISGGDVIALGAQVASAGSASAVYYNGELGEAGIYNTALSGSDLTNLTTALKTYWGVP